MLRAAGPRRMIVTDGEPDTPIMEDLNDRHGRTERISLNDWPEDKRFSTRRRMSPPGWLLELQIGTLAEPSSFHLVFDLP